MQLIPFETAQRTIGAHLKGGAATLPDSVEGYKCV
jgi:hypothetical protein